MKGFKDKNKKFHPIKNTKGVRKSRDQSEKTQGVKIRKARTKKVKANLPEVDISEHYWGFETMGGKITKLRLGNWSDAGWHWDGDEDDILGYLIRINKSRVDDEFIKKMEDRGITYKKLKPLLLKKIEEGTWLYEISGDNVRWHFHDDIDEGAMVNEEFERFDEEDLYSEEDQEKISDELWNISYTYSFEEFEEDYGDGIKKELKEMIKDSNTYQEFFDAMNDESFTYQITENYVLGAEEKIRDAIYEAIENLKKKGEIALTKKEEIEMKAEKTEEQIAKGKQMRLT